MKYIIVESETGLELPIVFNSILTHKDVARPYIVVSAGFCSCESGKWTVWGESVSLQMKSRPQDEKILNNTLNNDY